MAKRSGDAGQHPLRSREAEKRHTRPRSSRRSFPAARCAISREPAPRLGRQLPGQRWEALEQPARGGSALSPSPALQGVGKEAPGKGTSPQERLKRSQRRGGGSESPRKFPLLPRQQRLCGCPGSGSGCGSRCCCCCSRSCSFWCRLRSSPRSR